MAQNEGNRLSFTFGLGTTKTTKEDVQSSNSLPVGNAVSEYTKANVLYRNCLGPINYHQPTDIFYVPRG